MVPQCGSGMNDYQGNQRVAQPFMDRDEYLKQIIVTPD